MSRIRIAPIVEGHGDNAAVRNLLYRVWTEEVGGEYAEVVQPIRCKRDRLLQPDKEDLEKAVRFAVEKLGGVSGGLILILIDAEGDCAKMGALGPLLLARAKAVRADADIACVIANVMYETWFVAAAESLTEYLDLGGKGVPSDREKAGAGKGWVKQHMLGNRYSETADQARLTTRMDLALCRSRSKSFDKLCRELGRRVGGVGDERAGG